MRMKISSGIKYPYRDNRSGVNNITVILNSPTDSHIFSRIGAWLRLFSATGNFNLSTSQKSQIFENLCELIQIPAFNFIIRHEYLLILLWLNIHLQLPDQIPLHHRESMVFRFGKGNIVFPVDVPEIFRECRQDAVVEGVEEFF